MAYPFTPAVVDQTRCLARIWNYGQGGQCSRSRCAGDFCFQHAKDEFWRSHGRVTGPVPPAKLRDFQKEQAKASREGATRSQDGGALAKGLKALESKTLNGSLAEADGEDDDDVGSSDDDALGSTDDRTTLLRFGSGAVVGAALVAAHAKRGCKQIVADSPLPPAPGTPPRVLPPKRSLGRYESEPKLPDCKRRKRVQDVRAATMKEPQATACVATATARLEFEPLLEQAGVPPRGQSRLLPLLERWSRARLEQIVGLWTLVGDGDTKPVSAPAVHVWGPQGTGKSAVLFDFLDTLDIRSVWLDCACFAAAGELQARVVELVRRAAVEASKAASAPEAPKDLQHRVPLDKQLYSLEKLEVALRPSLEYIAQASRKDQIAKVVIVLDNAQELSRLGPKAAERLVSLPQVLLTGSQLSVVTVARSPLSVLGALDPARDPPQVAFRSYTAEEAEDLLFRQLDKTAPAHLKKDLKVVVSSGLMKFAKPHLGPGLGDLLSVGEELLRDRDGELASSTGNGNFIAQLQHQVEKALASRRSIGNPLAFLEGASRTSVQHLADADPQMVSTMAAMDRMTKAEKRLTLSVYLAARIRKEDDMRYFCPERQRQSRRGGGVLIRKRADDDKPPFARAPRPAFLSRVLAVYHRLARQPHLLGAPLIQHLARLREFGLIRVEAACKEHDARVHCCAELSIVRACAGELNVDLAEYLCKH
mmetsp:Transcript_13858/g.37662  ORF Transcript_13858/g.37662 Transcript_13858/m.37662 type:complete len:706 (-) Transcript_13858:219-2336(-)